jgi:hypothetical protein
VRDPSGVGRGCPHRAGSERESRPVAVRTPRPTPRAFTRDFVPSFCHGIDVPSNAQLPVSGKACYDLGPRHESENKSSTP